MPRKRNKKSFVPKESILETPINEDIKLETMEVEETIYFPCRVCNRLFKEHKQAMEHIQKCKPRIYLKSQEELTKKKTEQDDRDPYEIIPEEMDRDMNINNNNSVLNKNKNSGDLPSLCLSENLKRKNEKELKSSPKKKSPPSPDNKRRGKKLTDDEIADRLRKISESLKSCKKTVETEIIQSNKICKPPEAEFLKTETKECNQSNQMSESRTTGIQIIAEPEQIQPKKCLKSNKSEVKIEDSPNTFLEPKRRTRRGKKKPDSEINDRLSKISQISLRNGKQRETKILDDDEEDERRAIEERLSTLNKDSEILMYDNEEEVELQAENERRENVIVVTQRPDGQLHGCKKCSEVFVTALELLRHMRSKHTYPRIVLAPSELKKYMGQKVRTHCPICEKPLPSTYRCVYLTHLKTHSGLAEYECSTCKKKFTRKDHMKAHQKRHIV